MTTTEPAHVERPRTDGPATGRVGATCWVLGALLVALGGYERWWMSAHTIGTLTSDGAVMGLMALHLLHHGQFFAYMWGQAYGGGAEVIATAVVFLVAGVGTSQLLATTAITSFLAAFALWRAARRLVGERAALFAALALWVWPVLYTWRSIKPGGTYIVGLAFAWCAVGYLVRLKRGEQTTKVLVAAGIFCGLAFWSSPMTLQVLFPTLLWCLGALRGLGRRFLVVLGGAVLGALPAIVFGVTHAFSNLSPPNSNHVYEGIGTRFVQFFTQQLPIATSLRVEGSLAWVGGPLGPTLTFVVVAGLVGLGAYVVRHRGSRCELPMLAVALLPVLYALNTLANHVGQGRYVLLGSTMGMLLVGVGIDNAADLLARGASRARRGVGIARQATPVVALGLLATLGVVAMNDQPGALLAEFPVQGVPMPPTDTALRALVARYHVTDAFAGYWMAYRLMFETNEHVTVTPISLGRYPPIRDAVLDTARPAWLFLTGSKATERFISWCTASGFDPVVHKDGAFTLVLPAGHVVPGEVPQSVLRGTGASSAPGAALGVPRAQRPRANEAGVMPVSFLNAETNALADS